MKSYRQELWMNIPARMDFENITPRVQDAVNKSGVNEGLVLVNGKQNYPWYPRQVIL